MDYLTRVESFFVASKGVHSLVLPTLKTTMDVQHCRMRQRADMTRWIIMVGGALVFAAHFERRGVDNLFFDSSNVDVDTESLSRALKVAADGGHKEIFNFILDSGSIDVDTESLNSALSIAARMGHQDVVDLLRSRLDSL